jgi:hypothetical protein
MFFLGKVELHFKGPKRRKKTVTREVVVSDVVEVKKKVKKKNKK